MAEASLLGVARPFLFHGKQYFVAVRDLFAELAFADWVMADAGLALARMRPRWPADFYAEQMKILNGKIAGKQFRWGSEDVHAASWSEEGRRQLLYLKMKRGEENGSEPVERDLLDEIAKDAEKYAELDRIMMEQDYPFLLELSEARKPETTSPPDSPSSSPPPDTTPKA